jgi:hypothetical protein
MLQATWRRWTPPGLIVAVVALAFAASAGATTTYQVSGKQIAVDEDQGTFVMRGGLVGDWAITSYTELQTSPIYKAKGTELFAGCIDVHRDGSCKGDPSGKLRFTFKYWAQFDSTGALVWGSCVHPITGGTGAFANARGVLAMVDTPTAQGVSTSYIGHVTLGGGSRGHARARVASAAAC